MTHRKQFLLLVEGKDDKAFFEEFLKHLTLDNIQVEQLGGESKLKTAIKLFKDRPEFLEVISLGVVIDADTNPDNAFKSVVDALREADLPTPSKPLESAGTNPKVTVLILPDEKEKGELEDLYIKSVEEHPLIPCVNAYFKCLNQNKQPIPSKLSKKKVQVFLASKEGDIIGIRRAAKEEVVQWDHKAFNKVKDFLIQISEH